MTVAAAIAVAHQVSNIPLAEIDPSPTNPRKTFTGVDELAADFLLHGVLVPLIVRARGKRYECVDGERRLRAAKVAKLAAVPAQVRELTDLEVLEIQIVTYAQRADVHPVEEAEAYRQLRDVHKLSIEEIAAKVGRPKGTIYGRLKLCELAPDVRKAALEGKLPASHAVLIARIPDKKLQAEALKEIVGDEDEGVMTYRDALDFVHRRFMLQLANAPFDTADEKLVPAAGSCAKCPKRTGNQRELFHDIKSPDTCTDTVCFSKKVAAAAEVKLKVVEEKGKTVLRGDKAENLFQENYNGEKHLRHDSGFVPLQPGQTYVEGRGYVDVAAATKKNPNIKTVVVAHPDTGKPMELVPVKELPKAKERAGHNYAEQEKRRLEKEAKKQAFANSVVAPLVARAEKGIGKPELIAMVAALLDDRVYAGDSVVFERRAGKDLKHEQMQIMRNALPKSLPKKNDAELRGLLFELVVINRSAVECVNKQEPEGTLAIAAKALGVSVKGAKAAFEAEPDMKPKTVVHARPPTQVKQKAKKTASKKKGKKK